ncbi:MAG: S8 family peptidase [Clostridiales bacterium]|jgi:serine protease AprX|nr:S8 family peptidase [Clostridiales bacterium]
MTPLLLNFQFSIPNPVSPPPSRAEAVVYATDYIRCGAELRACGAEILREFPFIGAYGVRAGESGAEALSGAGFVQAVAPHSAASVQMRVAREILDVGALHAAGIYGQGVTVAIIDTGVYPHLDFMLPENRLLAFVDFLERRGEPYDDNGHGTFVAGAAVGNGLKSSGLFRGVAPRANLIALRAMDKKGEGGAFGILEAMQWIYFHAEEYNIRVACMSFGSDRPPGRDPLIDGAEALWDKGITVVAAAGNSGPRAATIKSPGASSAILTVGGMDDGRRQGGGEERYRVADFSSRGPVGNLIKPDIIAPAVNIVSASNDDENYYSKMSGTSVAAPMVAGLACLLLCKNPELTPDRIKKILMSNAKSIRFDRNAEGSGFARARLF